MASSSLRLILSSENWRALTWTRASRFHDSGDFGTTNANRRTVGKVIAAQRDTFQLVVDVVVNHFINIFEVFW